MKEKWVGQVMMAYKLYGRELNKIRPIEEVIPEWRQKCGGWAEVIWERDNGYPLTDEELRIRFKPSKSRERGEETRKSQLIVKPAVDYMLRTNSPVSAEKVQEILAVSNPKFSTFLLYVYQFLQNGRHHGCKTGYTGTLYNRGPKLRMEYKITENVDLVDPPLFTRMIGQDLVIAKKVESMAHDLMWASVGRPIIGKEYFPISPIDAVVFATTACLHHGFTEHQLRVPKQQPLLRLVG